MKKILSFICLVVGICIISITGSGCKNAKSSNLGLDTITIDAASYVSEEVIAKEKLEDILKELVGIADGNVILSKVNKFCTEEFKTGFKQACDQADKEGCERPRLWWSYSDDDPEKYEIKEIVMTSDNVAKAEVKLLSEMYIGRFNVVVKKEGDTWLIDKIDEVETQDNPNFDISDNTDGSSSTIEMSGNNDIRVKEYQEKTMRCVGKIQDIMRQINSIYNSYVSASIRIDDIRKQSLGVNAIADISDLIIKGDDIFKEMIRLANEYGQQGNISTLRAEQEDFKKQGYQMSTNIRRDIYNENY